MSVILLLASLAATLCAALRLAATLRARNKRRLLDHMQGLRCEAPGDIGISVLCTGTTGIGRIEQLLSSEYARYEVIVVLDAERQPELFAALTTRYRMIRTTWRPTGELQVEGVRSLSRSRERRYRRLSIVDRAQDSPAGELDAAAAVAAYDYLLPLGDDRHLASEALERLAAELGEEADRTPEYIRTAAGERLVLVARERIVEAGGFGRFSANAIPRTARRTVEEHLTLPGDPQPNPKLPNRIRPVLRTAAAALLIAATLLTAAAGQWTLTAVLLTAAFVWATADCTSHLLRPRRIR